MPARSACTCARYGAGTQTATSHAASPMPGDHGAHQRLVGRQAAVHLPVAGDQFLLRRHRVHQVSTILPMCWFDSISACALAASAAGEGAVDHGLDRRRSPAAARPWPCSACAIAALNATGPRPQRRAGDRQAPAQHQAGIELALDAALHRDDDQPAVLGQALDLARHVGAGDHVEDHVDALAAGELLRLFGEVLGLVVDGVVGAELQAGLALVVAAGRGDHRGAQRLGHLDRRDADAAGAALDQQGLARLQAAAVEHVAPHGEEGLRQRGRLDVAQALGHRQALAHRRHAQLA